jgi:hypothetical protein
MTIIEVLASSEELRNVGTLLSSKGSPDKLLERSRSERHKVHTPFGMHIPRASSAKPEKEFSEGRQAANRASIEEILVMNQQD